MFINQVTLATQNIEKQFDFYTRVLRITTTDKNSNGFSLAIGSSILRIITIETPITPFYHFAFNIPDNKFSEAKEWLMNRVQLLKDVNGVDEFTFNSWEAHSCYFKDADGNIGELIARHQLTNISDVPFSSLSLINVSEIGIVVDDVPKFVYEAQSLLESPIYHGVINEHFTPLGDEHGLLIVVKRSRMWFPEGKDAATDAPMNVIITDQKGRKHNLFGPPYRFKSIYNA